MENKPLTLEEALSLIKEKTSYNVTEDVLGVYVRRVTTLDSYERFLWNSHREVKKGYINYIINIIVNDDRLFRDEKRLLQEGRD